MNPAAQSKETIVSTTLRIRKFIGYLAVSLMALGSVQHAQAQVMVYLDEGEPAFWLTYPDGWDIRMPRSEHRDLISSMPADGSLLWQGIWIVRDAVNLDEAAKSLDGMEKRLFRNVQMTREAWDENIGPLVVRCREGTGVYEDKEAVRFRVCVFELSGNRVGALAYMGDPGAIDARQDDLDAMVQSLEAGK